MFRAYGLRFRIKEFRLQLGIQGSGSEAVYVYGFVRFRVWGYSYRTVQLELFCCTRSSVELADDSFDCGLHGSRV